MQPRLLTFARFAIFALACAFTPQILAAAPSATTSPATAITTSSALLNGLGNPHNEATAGWFRHSTTNPVSCNDTFGSRAPAVSGADLGAGNANTAYAQSLTGLTGGVTYYFCAIVSNASGTAFGNVLSFQVPAPPTVTTSPPMTVTSSSATLFGSAIPNGVSTIGWFRYSTANPGTCNDTFGTRAPATAGTGVSLGAGSSNVAYTQLVSGLTPGTTYFFCALASNAQGASVGGVLSFTALAALPVVITSGATSLTGSTALLNGSANPGGDASTGWFRYHSTNPGLCNDIFGTRAPLSGSSSLGAGNSGVAFSQAIAGLSPGSTYYFCAIAANSVGTSFGSVVSFTTPAPPTAATTTATSITSNSATLNGSGNPNRASAIGWFRYSLTSPGSCNDTFGSRAPTTVGAGSALGAGSSSAPYTQPITGLSPGTTYYFCAIVSNSEGTAFGLLLSFTTLAAPSVTTLAQTLVTSSSATLNATANPNGATTLGWFRYSTVNPFTCDDSFGTRAPLNPGSDSALGSGSTPVAYSQAITGLTPATPYFFCAIASNVLGTSSSAVLSFTTPAAAPSVTTGSTTSVTGSSAQLNGSANPGGDNTTGWFRYHSTSPGTCNDSFGTRAPLSGGSSLGAGNAGVAFSQAIAGLTSGLTYYVCAIAANSVATSFGSVLTFTTAAPPTASTSAATSITSNSAVLNGSGNPNRASAIGWFRYSTTSPGSCNDTFGSRAPTTVGTGSVLGAGSSSGAYTRSIPGLTAGTTYYFCAIVSNSEGTAFGLLLSFTTPAAPSVTTLAQTLVTSSSATLNATANPNGDTALGWFRYSTVNPGACDDTFGTRTPAGAGTGTALGAGSTPVAYSQAITGLTPATPYFFCAIASNTLGTSSGAVLSFTTSTAPPTVTTNNATSLTGSSAQLNGSANPDGDGTTGWFRYATTSPGTCNDSFGTRAPLSGGSSLGAGNAGVAFSQAIAGLTAGTQYFFCAIAGNSVGTSFGSPLTFTPPTGPLPDLKITKTHSGNFSTGQIGAAHTITVSNSGVASKPASDAVSVTDTVPLGLTITEMSGSGWSCTSVPTCTRVDALASGLSYAPITVVVTVAANAAASLINSATVATTASESDVGNNSASDTTTVITGTLGSLAVTKSGTGAGSVISADGGVNCSPTCVQPYVNTSVITLVAVPSGGSVFTGWLGACTGTGTCLAPIAGATAVSATFAPSSIGTHFLDIDANTLVNAATDGVMVVRHLIGLTGTAVTTGAMGGSPGRSDPAQIDTYLINIRPYLDADGNGVVDALTDGLLILRDLLGLTGPSLIQGAIGPNARRISDTSVHDYLTTLKQ